MTEEQPRWSWDWHTLRLKRWPHDPLAMSRRLEAIERSDWAPLQFLYAEVEVVDPNQGKLL